MIAVRDGSIVAGWSRNAFGMPAFRVHAADYPEAEAEGRTPDEACDRLIGLLAQAIDHATETWKSRSLDLALAEARAFAVEMRGFGRIPLRR
jgi:hypothetical protein